MLWKPSQSPALNQIESLWYNLKIAVCQRNPLKHSQTEFILEKLQMRALQSIDFVLFLFCFMIKHVLHLPSGRNAVLIK